MATLQDLDAFMGGVLATKAQVIYNGVGAESFAVGPLWPHPQSYIFAMGRFVAQKGFATLLRGYAAAQHCRADLLIAGDGPEGERLRSLSGELGLGGRVHFVGRAHRGMVHALLRGAQGFVVPSLREPMGIVALEAMAAGKPLLVSAVDGLSEIAPEGEWCRQVPPGDVTALASGLDWLDGVGLQSPVRHQQEYARQFLWDKIARAYVDLYENVGVMG
jgi:glycosyltransferase involved in cell wall biosynthesis